MAKDNAAKRYTVLHPLLHDKQQYDEGDAIDLTGEHAPALLRRGIIAEPKPAKDAAKK
jgi:hypothetical protein